ncbi:hypothetical protein ACLOJK_008852 [Asimina triloba]
MADRCAICNCQPPLPFSFSLERAPHPRLEKSMAVLRSPPAAHAISSSKSSPPSLLVFSGGTAFNGIVEELKKFTTRVTHVLPVSDDGGSTAEIVRVLEGTQLDRYVAGGPAVGDIRSRCLRLSDERTAEAIAVRRLLGHRLSIDPKGQVPNVYCDAQMNLFASPMGDFNLKLFHHTTIRQDDSENKFDGMLYLAFLGYDHMRPAS